VIIPCSIWWVRVKNLWYMAFLGKKLTSVEIPDSVTSIWFVAFKNNKLTSVKIPSSITSLWYWIFVENKLTSVVNYDWTTSTEYIYFPKDWWMETLHYLWRSTTPSIPNQINSINVTNIWDYTFSSEVTGSVAVSNITIPNSVKYIWSSAFYWAKLKSITIPSSVEHIWSEAFRGNELTNVTIPSNVKYIWNRAFWHNSFLKTVVIEWPIEYASNPFTNYNEVTSITNYDWYVSDKFLYNPKGSWIEIVWILWKHTSMTIPNSINWKNVVSIWQDALRLSFYLTNLTIPEGVVSIWTWAFAYNDITNIIIPSSVTSIWQGAFEYTKLTSITIPSNVDYIWDWSFSINPLTSITIQNPDIIMGYWVFLQNSLPAGTYWTVYWPQKVKDTYYNSNYFDMNVFTNWVIQ
jgi:hypothetical protein